MTLIDTPLFVAAVKHFRTGMSQNLATVLRVHAVLCSRCHRSCRSRDAFQRPDLRQAFVFPTRLLPAARTSVRTSCSSGASPATLHSPARSSNRDAAMARCAAAASQRATQAARAAARMAACLKEQHMIWVMQLFRAQCSVDHA